MLSLWQSLLLLLGWSFVQSFILTLLAHVILPPARRFGTTLVLTWASAFSLETYRVLASPAIPAQLSGKAANAYTLWDYLHLALAQHGMALFYVVDLGLMILLVTVSTWLFRNKTVL